MNGKRKFFIIPVAVLALGAAVFFAFFQVIGGRIFTRSAMVLDFTDADLTLEEYEDLSACYPGKEIAWLVPFQGSRYPQNTESLVIEYLTMKDVETLDALPALRNVDATACTDYDALLALQKRRPECRVRWLVPLAGQTIDSESTSLTISADELPALDAALPLLPMLENVNITGLPDEASLLALQAQFPGLIWHVSFSLAGVDCSEETHSLDLSGRGVSLTELWDALPLMPQLEELNLTGITLADKDKRALIAAFPDVHILCTLTCFGKEYRTDETAIDWTDQSPTLEDLQDLLPCFYQLEKLTLGLTKIENADLDSLNQTYPDTDIIWTLRIGHVKISTDAVYFFPALVSESNMPNNEELQNLRYCTRLIAIDIGHSLVTDCSFLNNTPDVKYLILADTPIEDITPVGNLKKLVYLELFCTKVTDYSPLLGCTALQDLNLGQTHGDPEPLSHMTWLHQLQWNEALANPDTLEQVQALVDELPDTVVLFPEGIVNIDGHWRSVANYYIFRSIIGGSYRNQECIFGYWGGDGDRILQTEWCSPSVVSATLREIIQRRWDEGESIPGVKEGNPEKLQQLLDSLAEEG